MNVRQLITELLGYPDDAPVVLSTRHGGEVEDFSVETSDDGWVVLEE